MASLPMTLSTLLLFSTTAVAFLSNGLAVTPQMGWVRYLSTSRFISRTVASLAVQVSDKYRITGMPLLAASARISFLERHSAWSNSVSAM